MNNQDGLILMLVKVVYDGLILMLNGMNNDD